MEFWLCGQYKSGDTGSVVWEFQGIFSTREKALAACRNRNYFIFPAQLDKEFPDESVILSECEYPIKDR